MNILHNHFLGYKYDFIDSASYIMDGIVSLHDHILYYEIILMVLVIWALFLLFVYKAPFSLKDLTHGAVLEIIWTLIPAVILVLIALPSFRLLYLMDDILLPNLSVKVIGFYYDGLKCIILWIIEFIQSFRIDNFNINFLYNFIIPTIKANKRIGPHNIDVLSILFGALLGDAYANRKTIDGVRICFRQSIIHKEYLNWLYNFFFNRGYVSNLLPRIYNKAIKGINIIYKGFEFNTFTFRSLNWLYDSFYYKGKKILPNINLLYIFLTPLALAVWIMDDGTFVGSSVRISSYNFTKEEHERLVLFFKTKYDINCTIQLLDGRYCLYIKANSLKKLRKLVDPYIIPSMKYKIGINSKI